MADFSKRTSTDGATDNLGADPGTSGRLRTADWGTQDAYWRDNYGGRPYIQADRHYEYYQPAYKYGHEAAFLYGSRPWDEEIEHDLARGWDQVKGDSDCEWRDVRDAVRDAYERSLGRS